MHFVKNRSRAWGFLSRDFWKYLDYFLAELNGGFCVPKIDSNPTSYLCLVVLILGKLSNFSSVSSDSKIKHIACEWEARLLARTPPIDAKMARFSLLRWTILVKYLFRKQKVLFEGLTRMEFSESCTKYMFHWQLWRFRLLFYPILLVLKIMFRWYTTRKGNK